MAALIVEKSDPLQGIITASNTSIWKLTRTGILIKPDVATNGPVRPEEVKVTTVDHVREQNVEDDPDAVDRKPQFGPSAETG